MKTFHYPVLTWEDPSGGWTACLAELEAAGSSPSGRARRADAYPWPTGPVVRLYEATVATIDLRTGGAVPEFPPGEALARWIRDALPRPPELVSRP